MRPLIPVFLHSCVCISFWTCMHSSQLVFYVISKQCQDSITTGAIWPPAAGQTGHINTPWHAEWWLLLHAGTDWVNVSTTSRRIGRLVSNLSYRCRLAQHMINRSGRHKRQHRKKLPVVGNLPRLVCVRVCVCVQTICDRDIITFLQEVLTETKYLYSLLKINDSQFPPKFVTDKVQIYRQRL